MRRAVPFAAVAALLAVGVWLLSRSPAQEDRLPTQATAASDSSRSAPTRPRAAPASSRAAAGAPFKTELTRAEVEDSDVANGAFAGTVINWGDGKPVAGAELAFEGQAGLETVSSGADGSFLFTPSGKGRYRLALVSKEGFLPYAPALGRSPIEAVPRPRTLVRGMRVYLSPAIDYRGRVVDADGEPIAAEIRLLGADTGEQVLSPIRDRFSAGDDGRFGFHAPDGAMLEARTADGRIGRGAIDGKVQVTHELVIVVTSNPGLGAARISGRVIGEDGQPIPGATVTCNAAGTMGMAFQALTTVRSGDDGRFELTADDSPRIQLRVEADGFVRKLVLVESMRQQIQVVLERGNQVAGTVSDSSGSPVPSFHVAVFTLQSAMQRTMVAHTAVISAEGKFAVGDLPPGDYQVQALAHGMARSRPVAARSGDTGLRITLDSGATLSGQVVDAASKQGLASAKVSVESSLGSGAAALPLTATAITDDDGRFRLSGLGPGPSSVVVAAYRHHGKIVSGLDANPGAQLGPVTIELEPLEEGESPEVEFAGIGAAIGGHQRGIAVQKVFPGGGAADAELATGDIITRVDGASVLDLGFEGSLQRIRGPVGTVVVLTIDRAGDELRQVSVRRKKLRF